MAREPFWPWLPVLIQTGPQQNGSWTLLVLTTSAHSNWSSWGATPWQGRQSLGRKRRPPMLPELSIMLPELSITRLSVSSPKPFPETEKHTNNVRKIVEHTHTHTHTHTHARTHTHTHTLTCVHPHHPTHIAQHSHNNKSKQTRQKWQKHANISKFDYGTTILQQCTM